MGEELAKVEKVAGTRLPPTGSDPRAPPRLEVSLEFMCRKWPCNAFASRFKGGAYLESVTLC